ncbi:TPA: hypothetical protein N0F65_010086 [Lagenidium giganteum]|uniref:Ndc10 domain-containing protein n=1 Tax=Lagenidium giganteum TaxID=4803 RepID=A0AAV2YL42_9STRA|nr:TPA: hypothetical protein N0F65_010086 [Lagenidium giganteum]
MTELIRRLGRWNMSSMEGCYLTALPRKAVRALAGFPADQQSFFLARALNDPPATLQAMVLGFVDTIWTQYMSQDVQFIAAGGFLTLLKYLRQDAVVMMEHCPSHLLWKHPVFSSTEWREYAAKCRVDSANVVPPAQLTLQLIVPDLSSYIKAQHDDMMQTIRTEAAQRTTTASALQGSLVSMTELNAMVQRARTGGIDVAVRLQMDSCNGIPTDKRLSAC